MCLGPSRYPLTAGVDWKHASTAVVVRGLSRSYAMPPTPSVITWEDVSMLMLDIEREYFCRVLVTLERPDGVRQNKSISVIVTARSSIPSDRGIAVAKASTYFPQRRHRSMPGALVYCLTEIGQKLQKRHEEAIALGQRRLPI